MTTSIPRPPQSAFQFHLGDEGDEKKGDKTDDCVDRNTVETKLPMLPSLLAKDNNHKQKLQLKLDSASLKVETVSKLVDTAMFRVRDRVTHWMESRLNRDAKPKRVTKQNGKILRLENPKVETISLRAGERRGLKWLVGRQKIKRDGDGTLSQFRNSSDHRAVDDNEVNAQSHDIEQLLNEVVIGESDKIQPNNTQRQSDQDENQQQFEMAIKLEDIQLAVQGKAAEEISMV